jgi:hypothetical protein
VKTLHKQQHAERIGVWSHLHIIYKKKLKILMKKTAVPEAGYVRITCTPPLIKLSPKRPVCKCCGEGKAN